MPRVNPYDRSIERDLDGHVLDEFDAPRLVKSYMVSDALGWLNRELIEATDPGLLATYRERTRVCVVTMGMDPADILGINRPESFSQVADLLDRAAKSRD
jgi:hypothetical protein